MSFSLTTAKIKDRSKTVTRRLRWRFLKPGDLVSACEKCMGLKPGQHITHLAVIRVKSVTFEPLDQGMNSRGQDECAREGFPEKTPEQFVEMFCEHMNTSPDQEITRIEFEYV